MGSDTRLVVVDDHFPDGGSRTTAVHGGFAATCLDGAAALALFSTLEASTAHSTVDLNVKYVRPLSVGETYRVQGWVVERTKSLAICDAQVLDAAGKLYAKATTTFVIRG